MGNIITEMTIYVKIKHVAKRRKQLKKINKNFLKKNLKDLKKVVDKIQTK